MHVYLSDMTRAQLVEAYNNLTGEHVNKFESHKVGCRRLTEAVCKAFDGATGGDGIIYMPGDVRLDMETMTFKTVPVTKEQALERAKKHLGTVELGEPSDPAPVPPLTKKRRANASTADIKPPKSADGVIGTIWAELDRDADQTKEQLLKTLTAKFPDRSPDSMATTIGIQRSRWRRFNGA